MKFPEFRRQLKNQQGMALVAVIVIFFALVVFTGSVVAIVYSDSKFSSADENGKMAYYAGRSAIEATEKAILDQINELNTEKGTITTNLREDINTLNESFMNGTITEAEYHDLFDETVDSYASEIQDYKDSNNAFLANVLPLSGSYTHKVTINGFKTDSPEFNVTLTPIMNGSSVDAYRMETQANVRGSEAKVAKWLGVSIGAADTITLNALNLTSPGALLFNDAIYSYGDLRFGSGGGSAKAEVTGGIKYEGNIYNEDNVNAGSLPYHKTPKTDTADIKEPASLLPIDPSSLDEKGSVLPKTITAASIGYYTGNVEWKENYTVDTSYGDVVLKFTQVTTTKNYKFYVTGHHNFYIYILDSVNPGVCVNNSTNTNNETVFESALSPPNTYIIIDQPPGQRDAAQNSMNFDFGKNNTIMEAYIYAPFTSLEFKNNFAFTGSIVAGGYDIWNKTSITYKEPEINPPLTDPDFISENYTIDLNGAKAVSYTKGSFWLKD